MQMTYRGEVFELPHWCRTWTRAEILEYVMTKYYSAHPEFGVKTTEDIKEEIKWHDIITELDNAGYTPGQVEEIVAYMACGHTLDSALQKLN